MKKKIILISVLIIAGFAFFLKNIFVLDPDFGWHFKMGEYILRSGIPATDPFSYTMLGFPFVDHEWFSNVIIFSIYRINPVFLYVLFALIPIAAIVICFPKNYRKGLIGIVVLSAAVLLSFSGVRVQEISWLFTAILLRLMFDPDSIGVDNKLWTKWRFYVPILILLWANLHGGFAISIFLLGIFITVRIVRKNLQLADIGVFLVSVLATLINPYGIRLWGEVISQLGNTSLHWQIIEWFPAIFFYDLSLLFLIAISAVLIVRYLKKIPLVELVFFSVLFILAVSSVRNVPFFIFANLFLSARLLDLFYAELKNKEQKARLSKVVSFFIAISFLLFTYETYSSVFVSGLSEGNYYPTPKAISFLQNNAKRGEIFSIYNWGGYLIWKLPEKKVFVDGRMPSWQWSGTAPVGQSDSAFIAYEGIMSGKLDYKKIFQKYEVRYMLLPKETKGGGSIIEAIASMFIKNNNSNKFSLQKLTHDGWRKIYEDKNSGIFSPR